MLEDIINLVKQHAGEALNNDPAVPAEHKEAIAAEAGSSIVDGFKNMIGQGQAMDLLSLFSHPKDEMQSHPAVQQISNGFVQNLVGKLGIDPATAGGIASNLIPNVLHSLTQKANNTTEGNFNLESILGQFTGGQGGGLSGLLGSFTKGSEGGEEGNVLNKLKGLF